MRKNESRLDGKEEEEEELSESVLLLRLDLGVSGRSKKKDLEVGEGENGSIDCGCSAPPFGHEGRGQCGLGLPLISKKSGESRKEQVLLERDETQPDSSLDML